MLFQMLENYNLLRYLKETKNTLLDKFVFISNTFLLKEIKKK